MASSKVGLTITAEEKTALIVVAANGEQHRKLFGKLLKKNPLSSIASRTWSTSCSLSHLDMPLEPTEAET